MTKSLTAAELVKLARDAAPHILTVYHAPTNRRVFARALGDWGLCAYADTAMPSDTALWCLHDAENTASEEALTRALLASAVTAAETGDGLWLAEIGAQEQYGEERAEAISRLLDALLLEAPQ